MIKLKKSSFIEGTFLATLAIVIVKILGMLYVIPFYAMVGSKGSALYAYAYNIYVIFLDISTAGLPVAISKMISEYDTLGFKEAKERTYHLGKRILLYIAIAVFLILIIFAPFIAKLLLGDLEGGNTFADVTAVIRCISFAVLVVPFLSVGKGYLQGHKIINVSSVSQVIEQVVRIIVILLGCYLVLNVFNYGTTTAICVAVSGAFFGALVAYVYILLKIKKNKKQLGIKKYETEDDISNKEIVSKMIQYSVPFIIINSIFSLYNFVDMILISRTMNALGFSAENVEFITTSITTWSGKISMIITSVAMGMTISLIPTIVQAFTKNNFKDVNNKFNQAFQIIIVVSLPMTIGLCLLSKPVWSIFYGLNNNIGPMILAITLFVNFMSNVFMICSSTLQSLNKFKLVYKSALLGFVSNILMDVPLMLLFNKIGLPSYYGASVSSIIGYLLSVIYILICLHKECNLEYKSTFKVIRKLILPLIMMIIVVLGCHYLIKVDFHNRGLSILFVAISTILGGLTYLVIVFKNGLLKQVFGTSLYNKIISKITFGKVKAK